VSQPGNQPADQAAWQLFVHLTSGNAPQSVQTSLRLDGPIFMDQAIQVSIFTPEDVTYKKHNTSPVMMLGAPHLGLAAIGVNKWRNAKNRKRAEDQAATQWRLVGPLRIAITDQSTWIEDKGTWLLTPHNMVTEMRIEPHPGMTEMSRGEKHPVRFDGPGAAFAGILIAYFVYAAQFTAIPGLERFVAGL
jgi:hypothetical protein